MGGGGVRGGAVDCGVPPVYAAWDQAAASSFCSSQVDVSFR